MNILIIGMGPIGLYCGICLKKSQIGRDSKISIMEKDEYFTRDDIRILDNKSLQLLPISVKNAIWGKYGLGCYIKDPQFDQNVTCNSKPKGKGLASVPLSILQEELFIHAKDMNIELIRNFNYTTDDLNTHYQKFDYIIDTTGSNAVTRNWFGGKYIESDTIGYGFTAQFDTPFVSPSQISYEYDLRGIRHGSLATLPQERYRGFRSNNANYYIGIQLTRAEYLQAQYANTLDQTPVTFRDIVHSAAKFYGIKMPKNYQIYINTFPITVGFSDPFNFTTDSNTQIFLIGSALFNVHFFSGSSINYGFQQANALCKYINGNIPSTKLYSLIRKQIDEVKKITPSLLLQPDELKKCHSKSYSIIDKKTEKYGYYLQGFSETEKCLVLARAFKSKNKKNKKDKCSIM
jgi:hypothetical protein